jgi:integrase
MPKVNFYLQHPTKEKSIIYISVNVAAKRIQVSTGETIEPKFWNKTKKEAITKGNPRGAGINSILSDIKSDIDKKESQLKAYGESLTIEIIKSCIALARDRPPINQPKEAVLTFWEYFNEFLNTDRFTNDGLPIKPQSYKSYIATFQRLKEFEKDKRAKLNFSDFDKETIDKFKGFLFKRKQNNNFSDQSKKGLSPNTVALTIRRLKTILASAIDDGYTVPSSYRKVRASTVETTEIALSENELMNLFHLDLSNSPSYEKVRDLFLIGCYTALRFSDYAKVNYSNIQQWHDGEETTDYLSITTEKTGSKVSIPVLPVVESILKKYDGNLPKPYPNQVMNRYLKEIGKKACFESVVKVTNYEKGLLVENEMAKWEMISTHTARRTGATLIYNLTNDIYLCMSLTGHKSEKQFQKYIRNNEMDNAKKLSAEFKKKGFGQIYKPESKKTNDLKIA